MQGTLGMDSSARRAFSTTAFSSVFRGLEVLHIGDVVLHLLDGGHAAQNGDDIVERCREKRMAHEACDTAGLASLRILPTLSGRLESEPPLTGSMMMMGLLCFKATS